MATANHNYLVSEKQMKAVADFSRHLKKECPGCIVTGFQSIDKKGIEVLVQCPDTQYIDRICELSVEIADQYDTVIVPTPI